MVIGLQKILASATETALATHDRRLKDQPLVRLKDSLATTRKQKGEGHIFAAQKELEVKKKQEELDKADQILQEHKDQSDEHIKNLVHCLLQQKSSLPPATAQLRQLGEVVEKQVKNIADLQSFINAQSKTNTQLSSEKKD